MKNFFKHLNTITKHRTRVFLNGIKVGIGFQTFFHDLSKFSKEEYFKSCKYYQGYSSPVFKERLDNKYFSYIAKHHTGRNKHHWEYWVDFFKGHLIVKTMPFKYALEYVIDVISASQTYNSKKFNKDMPYLYVLDKVNHYYMSKASKEFILWCLEEYKNYGFKAIKKKIAYKKYKNIMEINDEVEYFKLTLTKFDLIKEDNKTY